MASAIHLFQEEAFQLLHFSIAMLDPNSIYETSSYSKKTLESTTEQRVLESKTCVQVHSSQHWITVQRTMAMLSKTFRLHKMESFWKLELLHFRYLSRNKHMKTCVEKTGKEQFMILTFCVPWLLLADVWAFPTDFGKGLKYLVFDQSIPWNLQGRNIMKTS